MIPTTNASNKKEDLYDLKVIKGQVTECAVQARKNKRIRSVAFVPTDRASAVGKVTAAMGSASHQLVKDTATNADRDTFRSSGNSTRRYRVVMLRPSVPRRNTMVAQATIALKRAAVSVALLLGGCGQGEPSEHPGKQTYERYCYTCHAAGLAGAPPLDDSEAWAPRLARGRQALLESVVQGMPPGMPPKGLCNTCSDAQLLESIDYMIESITASE